MGHAYQSKEFNPTSALRFEFSCNGSKRRCEPRLESSLKFRGREEEARRSGEGTSECVNLALTKRRPSSTRFSSTASRSCTTDAFIPQIILSCSNSKPPFVGLLATEREVQFHRTSAGSGRPCPPDFVSYPKIWRFQPGNTPNPHNDSTASHPPTVVSQIRSQGLPQSHGP